MNDRGYTCAVLIQYRLEEVQYPKQSEKLHGDEKSLFEKLYNFRYTFKRKEKEKKTVRQFSYMSGQSNRAAKLSTSQL